jgi:P4 family phage/plasmid primase-like protien
MSAVRKFVEKYKVQPKSAFTHTTIAGKHSASYYIPADANEDFQTLYTTALENGEDLNFTEKHRDISPMLIDLDFKQPTSDRLYTEQHILKFLNALKAQVKGYVGIVDEQLQFYILEKIEPRDNKGKGFIDGIHIVLPNVITKPEVQFIIRENIVTNDMRGVFEDTFTNSYEDIYDEAVIQRNNWFMYGSKKPDEEYPWVVSKIYDANLNEIENESTDEELVNILSIRNKFDDLPINADKMDEVQKMKAKIQKKQPDDVERPKSHLPSDFTTIETLVKMLKPSRADKHPEWINVGMCLNNIDDRLLDVWIEFSKQSIKFIDGECERLWRGFYKKHDGLTEGSLRFWAKLDSPEEYKEFTRNDLWELIRQSQNETNTDIAKVVHYLFKDNFICCYLNDKPYWFEFKNHRWIECPDGVSLRQHLSSTVVTEYATAATKYKKLASTTDNGNEQVIYAEIAKKLGGICLKLKMAQFKANIMKECRELFCVSKKDFYERLDENKYPVGFDNGVFDLEMGQFRNGLPTDYLTYNVGYELTEPNDEYIKKVEDLMTSIFPDDEVRIYIWITLAYALCGNKYMEFLLFWIGTGANGKGVLSKLIEMCFGEYCYNPDVTVFTTKKTSSSSANPELAKMKGKRIAIATEPNEDDKFQVGALKAWTGGDKIQARALYKDSVEFMAQFLIIIQMNHKPALSDFDMGIARRLKNVEFVNKFVLEPKLSHERLGNLGLKKDIESNPLWRQAFMHILLRVYGEHVRGDKVFQTPKAVQQFTDDYLAENNKIGSFLAECCEVSYDENDVVLAKDLFELYKSSDFFTGKDQKHFTEHMGLQGFKVTKCKDRGELRDKRVFYGIKSKPGYGFVDDEEYQC